MEDIIQRLSDKKHLTREQIESVMKQIMSGQANKDEMASFLLLLREKGATVEEVTGAASIMREFVIPVQTKHEVVLDTCGTGGDKKGTFNISTLVALVVAGAGVIVAKHGNRSVSSKCGSADILEALGVNLGLDEKQLGQCLDEVGIAFLFAQKLHPAMKNVAVVRKELGVDTIFNILGPLTNPASASHQIIGVYHHDLVEPMANVLNNLGAKRALVVHGNDGLDEITLTTKTFLAEVDNGKVISYDISPEELGFSLASDKDLLGGDLDQNVQIFVDVIDGEGGPKRDIVILNAAYALYAAEKVQDIAEGIQLAEESIDSGNARAKLEELKVFTHGGK